ncbi:hypothetical protein V1477_021224 [Vespula maculifrons]|uniref:Uncharacterized protein n=1 Tax=Vespula maculifrons TaxID=7453 RepID=A0ABD2AGS3_VESMC
MVSKTFLVLLDDTINQRAGFERKAFPFQIFSLQEEEDKTFTRVLTTILEEINMALFYKALFEWWYEETEYILLKGSKAKRLN